MNTIKLLVLGAFAALAFAPAAHAGPISGEGGESFVEVDRNGTKDINRKWSPPKVCRVSKSSTCVLCAAAGSKGILTGIEVSSGSVGQFAVVLDTGALPSALTEPASSGAGALLTRQKTCEYTLATVDTNKGSCGNKEFAEGVPFSYGLTICAKDATTDVVV